MNARAFVDFAKNYFDKRDDRSEGQYDVVKTKTAEPAICQVQMYLFAARC